MSDRPISIAMATYNGAAHLQEQLQSLLDQTRRPDELVVTDDNSTDATFSILQAFARGAPFAVHIAQNERNLGFNRNFERALSLCNGSIVFISDQDDRWYPNKIETIVSHLGQSQALACIHDEHIYDEARDTQYASSFFQNARRLRYDDRQLLSGNCTAIRTELLDVLSPFPAGINYDYWIGWTADILGVRDVLPLPLQLYRRHGQNSSQPIMAEKSPTQLSVLMRFGLGDPRLEWAENARWLSLIAERIVDRQDDVAALIGQEQVSAALKSIRRELDGLKQRKSLVELPKPRRWLEVARCWRSGFYDDFSGVKSAVKDMIRP